MTTIVSFPLAKLLNSIGFDKYCSSGYTEIGDKYLHQGGQEPVRNGQSYYEGRGYIGGEFYCSAPTIAEVVMWLYENHSIWISVETSRYGKFNYRISIKEASKMLTIPFTFEIVNSGYDLNSPIEAYEAAFEYCLTKLI